MISIENAIIKGQHLSLLKQTITMECRYLEDLLIYRGYELNQENIKKAKGILLYFK